MTSSEIAERLGVVTQTITKLCRDVVTADQAHHDPSATVGDYAEAYPWADIK